MLELLILVAFVFLLAPSMLLFTEWLREREIMGGLWLEDAQFRYSSEFALSRPSAHAILTGITS